MRFPFTLRGRRAPRQEESVRRGWEWQRAAEAASAVAANPPDYKLYHQAWAAHRVDLTGKKVLVIGCNNGDDCRYFIERGAAQVTGLDVLAGIGTAFQHPNVSYVMASAEAMPLEPASFDLVFAYATLEHVPDVGAAFREMARVAAPGGFIYSAAAPLWCARGGPHWGDAFNHDPWPHLRLDVEAVIAIAKRAEASGLSSPYYESDRLRHHLTDPLLFNRRRADEYLDACSTLDDVEIIRNEIDIEAQTGYDPALLRGLVERGYSTLDLFGLTHMLVARKRGTPG
jgi:SAM-dependent methyltransferase